MSELGRLKDSVNVFLRGSNRHLVTTGEWRWVLRRWSFHELDTPKEMALAIIKKRKRGRRSRRGW